MSEERICVLSPLSRVRLPLFAVAFALTAAACLSIAIARADAAVGDHFGFAPVTAGDPATSAPAFPGQVTWWAGVCDLHSGAAATVALPPTQDRFAHCIDQQERPFSLQPPLAPGQDPSLTGTGPDGWRNIESGTLVTGPDWRLADDVRAGAHADGTAGFWLARAADRTGSGNIDS